jgi:hypothetical protein
MGRIPRRFIGGHALIACAAIACTALMLAGCGTVTPATPAGARTATASPGTGSPPTSGTPQQRAKADAAAILAAFVPPPGATRLSSAPGTGGGELLRPAFREDTPNQVNAVTWWHVPRTSPQWVLQWENVRLPRQFGQPGWGTSGPAAFRTWNLRVVPGVLNERQLMVEAVSDGKGSTDVRVGAHVDWLSPRPGWAYVPDTTRAVVITPVPGPNDKKKPPVPLTVTDPARVRALVSLVNALPASPSGVFSCPFDDGRGVRLTFLARVGGPVLATAFAKSNGCGGVLLVIGPGQLSTGDAVPGQAGLSGGPAVADHALAISGMRWKLFGYLPA